MGTHDNHDFDIDTPFYVEDDKEAVFLQDRERRDSIFHRLHSSLNNILMRISS